MRQDARGLFDGGKACPNIGSANRLIRPLISTLVGPVASPGSQLITPVNNKPNDAFTLCGIAVINAKTDLNYLEFHNLF